MTKSSLLCVMECFDLKAHWIIICAITQLNYGCLGLALHTVHLSDILELHPSIFFPFSSFLWIQTELCRKTGIRSQLRAVIHLPFLYPDNVLFNSPFEWTMLRFCPFFFCFGYNLKTTEIKWMTSVISWHVFKNTLQKGQRAPPSRCSRTSRRTRQRAKGFQSQIRFRSTKPASSHIHGNKGASAAVPVQRLHRTPPEVPCPSILSWLIKVN